MLGLFRKSRLVSTFLILILSLSVIYQIASVINDYSLIWLKRTYRNISLPSMERNALFLFGGKGTEFLKLISSSVPFDKPVVVPEGYGEFSEQSILQFFLMPRGIPGCHCKDYLASGQISEECKSCLLKDDHSIPAIGKFPPDELLVSEKKFIPFDPNWYRGIYVPPSVPRNEAEMFIEMDTSLPTAFVLDSLSILLIFLLGASIALTVDQSIQWIDLITIGVPIGGGILSWVIFIESWAGIPISLSLYVFSWLGIFSVVQFLRRFLLKKNELIGFPDLNLRRAGIWLRNHPHLLAIILVVVFLFLSSLIISIGRGYSLFDGIANWALKGYGIALERTVFAAQKWGGHSSEYPQNIHILIALFRILDGDVLPGSKMLFPLFTLSLISGCYSLWRAVGIRIEHAILGTLIIFSIPFLFLHSTIGWGNLIFSTYLVLAVCYFVLGIQFNQPRKFIIAGFLLSFAVWTRPEGIGYVLLLGMLFIGARWTSKKSRISEYVWLLPIAMVSVSWLGFSSRALSRGEIGNVLDTFMRSLISGDVQFDSLRYIVGYAYEQFTAIDTWGFVYYLIILFIAISFLRISSWKNSSIILTFVSGLITLAVPIFMFYAAAYSKSDMSIFLWASFNRAQFPGAILLFSSAFMAVAISHDP
jgi:hypothetical protein